VWRYSSGNATPSLINCFTRPIKAKDIKKLLQAYYPTNNILKTINLNILYLYLSNLSHIFTSKKITSLTYT